LPFGELTDLSIVDLDEWCFKVMKPIPFKDEVKVHQNLVQQHKEAIREIRRQNSLEKLRSRKVIE
jgi:hypothetical protein